MWRKRKPGGDTSAQIKVETDEEYEEPYIARCENGVGVWEVRSEESGDEVFDTKEEAEERLMELKLVREIKEHSDESKASAEELASEIKKSAAKRKEQIAHEVANSNPSSKEIVAKRVNRVVLTQLERTSKMHINQRLATMESLMKAVIHGVIPAVMVQSGPGIGKTHTLLELFKQMGLVENVDFIIIKAGVSAYGVYKQVCYWADVAKQREEDAKKKDGKNVANKKKPTVPVLVFDDVPMFGDKRLVDIMKGLMDTYKVRKITWLTDRATLDPEEAKAKNKLPAQVEYTGGVIILTNEELKKIDKPMMDRSIFMPIQVTDAEMMERMRTIAASSKFEPDCDPKLKAAVVNWMCSNEYTGAERSMRTLVKAMKLAQADPKNWRDLVQIV